MVDLWVPQRQLGGAFSVDECARRLTHYRLRRSGDDARPSAVDSPRSHRSHHKVEFGPMAYHCAQHADMLGKRLPELRVTEGAEGPYPLMTSPKMEPPNEEFRTFMEAIQDQEDSVLRVMGIFGVLKPHLATALPLPHACHRPGRRRPHRARPQVHTHRRGGAHSVGPSPDRGARRHPQEAAPRKRVAHAIWRSSSPKRVA